MKTLHVLFCSFLIAFILPKCARGQQEQPAGDGERTYYYGVEISEVLCGYAKISSTPEVRCGKKILKQEGIVHEKVSVLGGGVYMTITYLYLTNPETEQFFYNKTSVDQEDNRLDFASELNNDSVIFESVSGHDKKMIPSEDNCTRKRMHASTLKSPIFTTSDILRWQGR